MVTDLEKQFHRAMAQIYERAKTEAGYSATIYIQMVSEYGGLQTAKMLINADKPSEGYTELYKRGRLDLTVEALVVENPRWHSLFSDDEIKKARKLLEAYGYHPRINHSPRK